MKLTFLLLLISTQVFAGSISFIGPCSKKPLFEVEYEFEESQSVGKLTVQTLEENQIPFMGTEQGINSIFNTATGQDAMEVISDNEILAYGWCYKVNDFEPGEYPSQVVLEEGDHVTWWFGYAHYKNGSWIAQCEPSYERRSPRFCSP